MTSICTESLGAVHTHTHTHTPYIYKNEKIYTKVDSICDAKNRLNRKILLIEKRIGNSYRKLAICLSFLCDLKVVRIKDKYAWEMKEYGK